MSRNLFLFFNQANSKFAGVSLEEMEQMVCKCDEKLKQVDLLRRRLKEDHDIIQKLLKKKK